jgi:hypothetical protein
MIDTSVSTHLSIYSLSAPYDPNTATLSDVSYSSLTFLDMQSYSIPSTFAQVPLTFTISSALLEQWANDPSSNYGFIIVEASDVTVVGSGHTDIGWMASGQGAPALSFDSSITVPESATLLLIGPALAEYSWLFQAQPAVDCY